MFRLFWSALMFNYSSLWGNKLITNLRLASNQGKSFLVVLCHELVRHLQEYHMKLGASESSGFVWQDISQ